MQVKRRIRLSVTLIGLVAFALFLGPFQLGCGPKEKKAKGGEGDPTPEEMQNMYKQQDQKMQKEVGKDKG